MSSRVKKVVKECKLKGNKKEIKLTVIMQVIMCTRGKKFLCMFCARFLRLHKSVWQKLSNCYYFSDHNSYILLLMIIVSTLISTILRLDSFKLYIFLSKTIYSMICNKIKNHKNMFNMINQIDDDFITYNDTQTSRCGMYPTI